MALKSLRILVVAAAALMPVALNAGGWGVITLQHVPDSLKAGRPFTFVYTMRQHGIHPINGLEGRVEARLGSTVIRSNAHKLPPDGTYDATLTFPEPGTWTLQVISGANLSGHTLTLTVDVLDRHAAAPQLSGAERGRRLFAGKGCVGCHTHADFVERNGPNFVDLSKKRYTPESVQAFLKAVSVRPHDSREYGKMPNLGLAAEEIESLAAFLGR